MDEQNFMNWCQRNAIPWPGTASPMCMAWVQAAREERQACVAAGVSMAEQYEANAQLHPENKEFVRSQNDRAVGCLNLSENIRRRGQP